MGGTGTKRAYFGIHTDFLRLPELTLLLLYLGSGLRIDLLKVFYCFFRLASAFFKFSFNLNFTILLIRLKGTGLSNGNCTEPFAPL
jgi:hypothetical protein